MNTNFKLPTAVEFVEHGRRAATTIASFLPTPEMKDMYSIMANAQLNIATTVAEKYDETVALAQKQFKMPV